MQKELWYVTSFNFIVRNVGENSLELAKKEVDTMLKKCSINTVNIALMASQEHCFSTDINYANERMFRDEDLIELIKYCKSKDLKVILKTMINPTDGYWRAYIRFFDKDVPGEPTWSQWFSSNEKYVCHYAEIAQEQDVDMMIIGCEMVGTDHRDVEWRNLVSKVRSIYSGLLTYNCDKYQEDNVQWWDALDCISASGYYPIDEWDQELKRIEKVVKQYNKLFFFSESGCPSVAKACYRPNDWTKIQGGTLDLEMQKDYFSTMFDKCAQYDWHMGHSIWSWSITQSSANDEKGYAVLDKPAQDAVKDYYSSK